MSSYPTATINDEQDSFTFRGDVISIPRDGLFNINGCTYRIVRPEPGPTAGTIVGFTCEVLIPLNRDKPELVYLDDVIAGLRRRIQAAA